MFLGAQQEIDFKRTCFSEKEKRKKKKVIIFAVWVNRFTSHS